MCVNLAGQFVGSLKKRVKVLQELREEKVHPGAKGRVAGME
jgi:hypothetical protein